LLLHLLDLLLQPLDLDLNLNPTPHQTLHQPPLQEHLPELEPTQRLDHLFAETELRNPVNNAREEYAALTDANFTKPTDLAVSDLQELLRHALRNKDVTDREFADQPSSNKTH
jgi:hypothetical protein